MKAALGITLIYAALISYFPVDAVAIDADLARFITEKREQLNDLAGTNKVPHVVEIFLRPSARTIGRPPPILRTK